jgi:hypothetical protein
MSNPQYARQSQGGDPSNTTGKQDLRLFVLVPTGEHSAKGGWGEAGSVWNGEQGMEYRTGNMKQEAKQEQTRQTTSSKNRAASRGQQWRHSIQRSNLGNEYWPNQTANQLAKDDCTNRNIASLQRRQGHGSSVFQRLPPGNIQLWVTLVSYNTTTAAQSWADRLGWPDLVRDWERITSRLRCTAGRPDIQIQKRQQLCGLVQPTNSPQQLTECGYTTAPVDLSTPPHV